MRRICNLELRLVPPCVSAFSPKEYCTTTPFFSMWDNQGQKEKQLKQLTIFYNGKVVVSDTTELQAQGRIYMAKAIIYLASREMKENTRTSSQISEASSPLLQPQTGLSLKRSLQGFLQKRKNRIQATSPYHH